MKIVSALLILFALFLLPGEEKGASPARVSLLYKAVPGRLFSRIRPTPDIRLTIREAKAQELALLQKGQYSSPGLSLFMIPEKALPGKIPEGALLLPYALTGRILALHMSNSQKSIPRKTALDILAGKVAYWEKIPGRLHSGRVSLYGTRSFLPSPPPEEKGPLLIPAGTAERAGELLMLDPGGIGIFPLTFWEEKNLTLLSIDRIPPTPENFMNGKYPLTEKLFLYAPPAKGKKKELLLKLKALLLKRSFHIELLHGGILPLPPAEKP